MKIEPLIDHNVPIHIKANLFPSSMMYLRLLKMVGKGADVSTGGDTGAAEDAIKWLYCAQLCTIVVFLGYELKWAIVHYCAQ